MKNYLTVALTMLISIATGTLTTGCNSDSDEIRQFQIWLDNQVPESIPDDYIIISGEMQWRYGNDSQKVSTVHLPYDKTKGLTCREGTYYVEGLMTVAYSDMNKQAADRPGISDEKIAVLHTATYVKISGPGPVPITWTGK